MNVPDFNFDLSLDTPELVLLGVTALACLLLGWLLASVRAARRIERLDTELEFERRSNEERLAAMKGSFAELSSAALDHNSDAFLKLAHESLAQFHVLARGELAQREKAVESLVAPIREALKRSEEQARLMEKERREAYGALAGHLETLATTQQQLQGETRNLVQALRRPEVRGQWGELTLRRLAELSGMVEHCDFVEQAHTRTEDGAMRPDMVVRMPAGREVVVDVKTPLDAYLSAVEASDDAQRTHHLERHARRVRDRVKELASKAYWSQFPKAPEFVVLFIPGEQFLSAALDVDHDLLEDALRQKVILATPTSLVALLRAIAYGWRQESLTANAERIRAVGESLYHRLAVFAEHLAKLGRSLDASVGAFNRAVGSFDTGVLPGARRFTELGLSEAKPLPEPEQVEKQPREVSSAEKPE